MSPDPSTARKVAFFTFSDNPTAFIHLLLNALDMHQRGWDVRVIIEGDSTRLVSLLRNETKPGSVEWHRALKHGVIDSVCKACAARNGVLPACIEQGLRTSDEMNGHPSIARWLEAGYTVITL